MTDPNIPTPQDFQQGVADPKVDALIAESEADLASTNATVALGVAAQVLAAAAPLAGAAVGGPAGEMVGTAVGVLATSLAAQHTNALASLTPDQQAAITSTVATAASLATAHLVAKTP